MYVHKELNRRQKKRKNEKKRGRQRERERTGENILHLLAREVIDKKLDVSEK